MTSTPTARRGLLLVWLAACLGATAPARAATPADLLAGYRAGAGAGQAALADRGRKLFTATHGREWSCAPCHGAVPTSAPMPRSRPRARR